MIAGHWYGTRQYAADGDLVHPHRHLPLANAYICVTDAIGEGRTCQPPDLGAFGPLELTGERLK